MEVATNNDFQAENDIPIVEETKEIEFSEFHRRRSAVWKEYFAILPKKSKGGKLRAKCKHCKMTDMIAESKNGTTNAKNHLEKCKLYQRTLLPSAPRDNASSNDKAQHYLKATLQGWGCLLNEGKFFHVRCVAHVLNLIVKDRLKVINDAIFMIRESVKHDVKGSEGKKTCFRSAVDQAGVKETKALWFDVPTARWNSTYLMLDKALIYRDAFNKLNLNDKTYIYCPDFFEWEMVEKIRDVLGPFNGITELFFGSDYPTSNLYFENVWRITMLLKELVKFQSHDEVLRKMTIEMQAKFDKYWADSEEDNYGTLSAIAMVLDPRCKLHFLKFYYKKLFDDELKARANDVQYKLEMLLKEYKSYNTSSSAIVETNAMSNTIKRKLSFCEDYDSEGGGAGYDKSKLSLYLDDDKVDRNVKLDVLDYWKKKRGSLW